MKECLRVQRMLSRYLDKELPVLENARVAAHVEACPLCRRELAGLAEVKALVSGRERKSIPQEYLVLRLREEIARAQGTAEQGWDWLFGMGNFSRRLIPVPVTAIVLAVAFFVLSFRQQSGSYSLEEHLLNGGQTTTAAALELLLGSEN